MASFHDNQCNFYFNNFLLSETFSGLGPIFAAEIICLIIIGMGHDFPKTSIDVHTLFHCFVTNTEFHKDIDTELPNEERLYQLANACLHVSTNCLM